MGALDAHLAGGACGDERHGQPVPLPALQVKLVARGCPVRAIAARRCGSSVCPMGTQCMRELFAGITVCILAHPHHHSLPAQSSEWMTLQRACQCMRATGGRCGWGAPVRHDGRLEVVPGLVLHHQAVQPNLTLDLARLCGTMGAWKSSQDWCCTTRRLSRASASLTGTHAGSVNGWLSGTVRQNSLSAPRSTAARTAIDQMSQFSASPAAL